MKNILMKQMRWIYFGILNSLQFRDLRIMFSCMITRRLPVTTCIPHPVGIVLGGLTLGENVTILQNVTIGLKNLNDKNKKGPIIGNNVVIGSGACILGDIRIGNNVIIGANSVVLNDIESNTVVAGIPAKVVSGNSKTKLK